MFFAFPFIESEANARRHVIRVHPTLSERSASDQKTLNMAVPLRLEKFRGRIGGRIGWGGKFGRGGNIVRTASVEQG